MIEVKRFSGRFPSIAYTDCSKVYISNIITLADEYDTLYRHECGHIWLQHQLRQIALVNLEKENFDRRRWAIATDLEIALHLYNEDDEAVINRPRSELKGGISKKDLENYPDCIFAEDFYFKQIEQPFDNESHDGEANDNAQQEDSSGDKDRDFRQLEDKEKQALIELAKEEIVKYKNEIQKHKISEETRRFLPKASLASEIDKHLGRVALARVASYKRPNRREERDFMKKGIVSKEMAPLVTIYVDRSGSFCEKKTRGANKKLDEILLKYRAKIKKDVIFFHDTLFYEEPTSSGGTNYLDVANDIAKSSAKLAIIITDDDDCDNNCAEILKNCKTNILIIPIGCSHSKVASIFNAKEVNYESI